MSKDKIYLPGLNGIRAIAAIAVVFSHINHEGAKFNLPDLPLLYLAGYGVTMFFVLSGFLITFLLLKEKELTDTINYKHFFIRRSLRIWPLYFFYLFLLIGIYGLDSFGGTFGLYIAFLPNAVNYAVAELEVVPISKTLSTRIGHYWSLGVEEQFYLFWPLIIRFLRNRTLVFLIVFPIVFFLWKVYLKYAEFPLEFQAFFHYSRFGCLAIGGLGGYLYYFHKEKIKFVNSIVIQGLCWFVLVLVAINQFHIFSIIDHEIISLITLGVVFNQINSTKPFISLENSCFDFLGKISYGLYVYNPLIIALMIYLLAGLQVNAIFKIPLIYLAVLSSLILVSYLSFRYFESYFLRFKKRFVKVNSFSNKNAFDESK